MSASETNPKVHGLFSTPFVEYRFPDHESLCNDLRELFIECEGQGDKYRDPIRRDTQHGALFESRFDLFTWPNPPVKQLAQHTHEILSGVIQKLNGYKPAQMADIAFNYHAWFHVTRKGGYQGTHNHQNASWSGIFCIDPGDQAKDRPDSGAVRFYDPRPNLMMHADPGNEHLQWPFTTDGFQIQHEPGKLMLFPSYIYHEIFPYVGERPRVIVAFNCWCTWKRRQPA
jgi:uncharacterized protein (TIGR02466 family)